GQYGVGEDLLDGREPYGRVAPLQEDLAFGAGVFVKRHAAVVADGVGQVGVGGRHVGRLLRVVAAGGQGGHQQCAGQKPGGAAKMVRWVHRDLRGKRRAASRKGTAIHSSWASARVDTARLAWLPTPAMPAYMAMFSKPVRFISR